jgi:Cu2+-exporting ATPase
MEHAHNPHTHHTHTGHDPAVFRRRFWISLLLTIPVLVLSPMVQKWFGFHVVVAGSELIVPAIGVMLFFYGGFVFLKGARDELAIKTPGMMTLVAMAITVAFLYSLAVTFGIVEGMDFWWELATLVTIMLLGHWLEMAAVARAQNSLKELAKLLPDSAELIVENATQKVAVGDLKQYDLILIRPGGRFPVDGMIEKGTSDVNEAMLTGESRPVRKSVGQAVAAGTINGDGSLRVKVTEMGDRTALAGIMRLVAEAQKSKSRTQILADRAAYYLTFVALGAALLTWVGWLVAGASASFILERIVTVLVIACPHALGLAIPLVTAISTTLAARNGLLVRHRAALESARMIDVVLFDKTGTLTQGRQGVVRVFADDTDVVLRLAATVELESEHSIGRAIVAFAKKRQISIGYPAGVSALRGRGIKAVVDGSEVYVGGERLLHELHVIPDAALSKSVEEVTAAGQTVVYVIRINEVIGAITLADIIRDESYDAVAVLQNTGKRVALLTGDSENVAAWVAKELGVDDYFANVLPEHKMDVVKKLQRDGSWVAMVGDGVNDAPALTQADIGIAIGAGTDVAIESADIVLTGSDPRGVGRIVALSTVTYAKMKQNLAWAVGYNVIAIPLAAGVLFPLGIVVSPAVGAVLMSLSTLVVAANAQFLRRLKL